jgi:integrase/recombinase XerD
MPLEHINADEIREAVRSLGVGPEPEKAPQLRHYDPAAHENEQMLDAFVSAKRIEGLSEKSLNQYTSSILRLFDRVTKPVTQITADDVRDHLTYLLSECKNSKVSLNNHRRIFSSFFAWLLDEEHIRKNPMRRIKVIKTDKLIKETISDEGIELLRGACNNIRDLAIINFLASTGVRVSEMVGLNRDDIDFNNRECVVFGKGSKERVAYFDAKTKLDLQKYLSERKDDNPALFVSLAAPYERLNVGGVETLVRLAGQAVGLKKIHPHKFRRTMATRAIDKGMPIEQVQQLLGHVRINTTLEYALVNQANVKNSHRKFLG